MMRYLLLLGIMLSALSGCAPVMVAGGVAGGALLVSDRRSNAVYLEDQATERKINTVIEERYGTNTHVNVTSFNRQVLLTGEVPDQKTSDEVMAIARQIANIRTVFNETRVGPVSSLAARSQDVWLTSQARTHLLGGRDFSPSHIKTVTENSVIYLMGLVSRKEGAAAASMAARVPGTHKVVTLFEYND